MKKKRMDEEKKPISPSRFVMDEETELEYKRLIDSIDKLATRVMLQGEYGMPRKPNHNDCLHYLEIAKTNIVRSRHLGTARRKLSGSGG